MERKMTGHPSLGHHHPSSSVVTIVACIFIIIVSCLVYSCDSSPLLTQEEKETDHAGLVDTTDPPQFSRHKRFILQFQVPQPVGHFRLAMMPPFIRGMMANIPNMIRRSFIFGGNKQQQEDQALGGVVQNH